MLYYLFHYVSILQVDTAASKEDISKVVAKFLMDNHSGGKSTTDSSSSNTSSRSNSPAVPIGKPVLAGAGSSLRGILASPPKVAQPVQIISDVGPASSALLGLLNQPPTIRTLSPFPKPPLSSALEAARYAPRRSAPFQNRGQQNSNTAGGMSSSLISAIASSAAKDALAKFGTNRPAAATTATSVVTTPTKSSYPETQAKSKRYDKDSDFRSKAKPIAGAVSTRPKRGKQRRNFSDLLQDSESEEEEEESQVVIQKIYS